jgi:hypothetical protein
MADISDVELAFVEFITTILYPRGLSQGSIIGSQCRIYRGWPNSTSLNSDLGGSVVNITVVSDNDSGRTTTRYLLEEEAISGAPGVVVAASGNSVFISGQPEYGDAVGLLIDGIPFEFHASDGDTVELVAGALGQLIRGSRPCIVQGATITIPDAHTIRSRAVCSASTSYESRRQEKDIRVVFWCPAPSIRDSVAAAVDSALSPLNFLPLADGTAARIVYKGTSSYDQAQNALLYRRDVIFTSEYSTIVNVRSPVLIFNNAAFNDNTNFG